MIIIAAILVIAVTAFAGCIDNGEDNGAENDDAGYEEGKDSEMLIGKWRTIEVDGEEFEGETYHTFYENGSYHYYSDSENANIHWGEWEIDEEVKELYLIYQAPSADLVKYSFSHGGDRMTFIDISWGYEMSEEVYNRVG